MSATSSERLPRSGDRVDAVAASGTLDDVDWRLAEAILAAIADPATGQVPRHRHTMPRDEVRRRQQARILAALAREVAEQGYVGTTVAGIGRRAGVSSKTFYEVYADKEAAYLGLYVVLDAAIRLLDVALAGCHDVEQALDVGLRSHLRLLGEQDLISQVLTVHALGATPRIADRRARCLDRYEDTVARTAHRLGHHPSSELVRAAIGAINELVYQRLRRGEGDRLEELFAPARDVIVRLLAPGLARP